MTTNRLIHTIYFVLGCGALLLTAIPPSFAGSLPSCLRVTNQNTSSITVRNDCNKTVRYIVISPLALTFCQSIRPRESQTTRLPKISGIASCQ
jgi:hypothetical protein